MTAPKKRKKRMGHRIVKAESERGREVKLTRFMDWQVWANSNEDARGDTGLVLSIIERARRDFLFEKQPGPAVDAALFFLGPEYRHYMSLLGRQTRHLPVGITRQRCEYTVATWGHYHEAYLTALMK